MSKDSFIFHLENVEDIADLSLEEKGMIFMAMIKYAQTDEETHFDDKLLQACWRPILRRIKKDNEYYEHRSKVYSLNGSKGGAPKGNQNASKTSKNNQKQAKTSKTSHTDTDTDTDTDTGTDTVTDTDTDTVYATEPTADRDRTIPEPNIYNVDDYFKQTNSSVDAGKFYDHYGGMVGLSQLPNWQETADYWTQTEYPNKAKR